MNIQNLILLGEILNLRNAIDLGYERLDKIFAHIRKYGIHEYCSPTYTQIQLCSLGIIEKWAQRKSGRKKAKALHSLIWHQIAPNWLLDQNRLGGAQSRQIKGWLDGAGRLEEAVAMVGWATEEAKYGEQAEKLPMVYPSLLQLKPHSNIKKLYDEKLKKQGSLLVRQRWNEERNASRTAWISPEIVLSSAGKSYDLSPDEDMPLTIDVCDRGMKKPQDANRCFFVADTRSNPFGIKSKMHHKPLLWAAAQRSFDVLSFVLYRPRRQRELASHFVMPALPCWIGDRPVDMNTRGALLLNRKDALTLRFGRAAMGIRVLWARSANAMDAPIIFSNDVKNRYFDAMLLTVKHDSAPPRHKKTSPRTQPGAVFWVRVGRGLRTNADFEAWRDAFIRAKAQPVRVATRPLPADGNARLFSELYAGVKGVDGPLSLHTVMQANGQFLTQLTPSPSRAVLEVEDKDIGRTILKGKDPFRATD